MNNNNRKQQVVSQTLIKNGEGNHLELVESEFFDEFALVREHTKAMELRLLSEEMTKAEHGEIEQFITKEGNEMLRLYLQGVLDFRQKNEKQYSEVIGADEEARTHVRPDCKLSLASVFGEVEVRRMGYSNRKLGSRTLFPMDMELNLPPDKYSHGLSKRTTAEAGKQSYDEALASLRETTVGKVPKRQAQEVVIKSVQDFEDFYFNYGDGSNRMTVDDPATDLMILTFDGKGIVMRPKSLREATQLANAKDHKLKTRLSKGEKRNGKRMAMVVAVYSITKQIRTAEGIMASRLDKDNAIPKSAPNARARGKRVWASVKKDALSVIREGFEEALRQDPKQLRKWVILIDGQPQQLKNIKACMKEFGVKADLILDFIHVLEYLWKAAYCFEIEGSAEAEAWVEKRILQILRGKASYVAAGIRGSATKKGLSTKARSSVDTCANYLLKYKDMLRYDQFLASGFPIATGVIEGACRHLIKDRMDITGARWNTEGAEAILKLRSLHSSGDWNDYWTFHQQQELKRNHISKYSTKFFDIQTAA